MHRRTRLVLFLRALSALLASSYPAGCDTNCSHFLANGLQKTTSFMASQDWDLSSKITRLRKPRDPRQTGKTKLRCCLQFTNDPLFEGLCLERANHIPTVAISTLMDNKAPRANQIEAMIQMKKTEQTVNVRILNSSNRTILE